MKKKILAKMWALSAAVLAMGCGADSSSSPGSCEALCQRLDDCPNTTPARDCLAECEELLAAADELAMSCPQAAQESLACLTTASCSDLAMRIQGSQSVECAFEEYQVAICHVVPDLDAPIVTACDATCSTLEACPRLTVDPNCRPSCIEEFINGGAVSEECAEALVDVFECLPTLSCAELEVRLNGLEDGCTSVDEAAAVACQT